MPRTVSVVLVALLVTSATAGVVLALPQTEGGVTEDVAAMLTVDSPSRNDQTTSTLDLSSTVGLQHDAATSRLEQHAFEERLENASAGTDREVVEEEFNRIDDRIDDLGREERAVRMDYVRRDVDTTTYLVDLARLDARATLLSERIADVLTAAETRGIDTDDLADPSGKLVGFTGAVRGHVAATLDGTEPTTQIDVAASGNGTVLSMIDRGSHVREAYRADKRTMNTTGTIPTEELFSLPDLLFSEAYEIEPKSYSLSGMGSGIYVIEAPQVSTYLTLKAYIDGDTRNIFAETQTRQLDRLPQRDNVSIVDNGTLLVVNRTFAGGPLRVATFDNSTGLPTSTTVVVDGTRFETDPDGELWTLNPRRYQFPVTAVRPGGNTTVQVQTLPQTSVGDLSGSSRDSEG